MKMDGDRIYIRPFQLTDSDIHALLDFRTHNRMFFKPFEPVQDNSHFTFLAQTEVIMKALQQWESGAGYSFGIFLRDSNLLLGKVTLSNVSRGAWQNSTIGYSLDESFNNKGYMTEALRLAVQFAFHAADLHRVQAAVMPHNVGSVRVLEKVGFRYEGRAKHYLHINGKWEDHLIYALTREDWSHTE